LFGPNLVSYFEVILDFNLNNFIFIITLMWLLCYRRNLRKWTKR